MTKVTISGNANGTGNVNFAAPNTNSAITVTLPTSNIDMDSLGAGTGLADVGSYVFAQFRGDPAFTQGQVISAANNSLRPTNAFGNTGGTLIASGSWRCMGIKADSWTNEEASTLFVRIS